MIEQDAYVFPPGTDPVMAPSYGDRDTMINHAKSDGETDLLKMLLVTARHKRMILITTLLSAVVTVLFVLWLPNQYTAETELLAPQSRDSMASLFSLSGALGGLGAAKSLSASALGLSDPNAMYIGDLQSRTVADRLIQRFDLKQVYGKDMQVDARKALAKATKVASAKDGGITIAVTDLDRKRAADLANAYVQELQQLTDRMASSEATQRSKYYERELAKVRDQLSLAQAALKGTQETTGMLDAATQVKSVMLAAVSLKAEIAAKEVELGGMSSFSTPQNPDLKVANDELTAMHKQLAQLKHGAKANDSDILVPSEKIPQAGLEYLRNYRDVMYYERIYDLLSAQYAAAKADEGRNAVIIQVVDAAEPPERKSKPHRALIVIFVTMLAGFGSLFAVYVKETLEQVRRDPIRAEQLFSLRTMLLGDLNWIWFLKPKAK